MNRILIPVDFSASSSNAVYYVLQHIKHAEVKIELLHVIEVYKYTAGTSESEIYTELSKEEAFAVLREEATAAFTKFLDDIRARVPSLPPVETKVTTGDLHVILQEEIARGDVMMVVLAGPEKHLKGRSLPENYTLARKLDCPVLIVPAKALPVAPETFLYAASLVKADIRAIEWLCRHAENFNAKVTVLHVLKEEQDDFYQTLLVEGFRTVLRKTVSYDKIDFIAERHRKVIEGIIHVARSCHAGVLVMMRKQHSLLSSLISKDNTTVLTETLNIPLMYCPESLFLS